MSTSRQKDDFELRLVEAMPLTPAPTLKSFPKIKPRSAPTSADAVGIVRATKGAKALIDRFPALADPALMPQVAHWSSVTSSGLAAGEPIFWGADFISNTFDVQAAYSNRYMYFAGHEFLGEVQKPNTLDGTVWCETDEQTPAGIYVFVAQFETYIDDLFSPGYFSLINFVVNGQFIGTRIMYPGDAPQYPFTVSLSAGMNRFQISQNYGAMFFQSLTMFRVMQTEA